MYYLILDTELNLHIVTEIHEEYEVTYDGTWDINVLLTQVKWGSFINIESGWQEFVVMESKNPEDFLSFNPKYANILETRAKELLMTKNKLKL